MTGVGELDPLRSWDVLNERPNNEILCNIIASIYHQCRGLDKVETIYNRPLFRDTFKNDEFLIGLPNSRAYFVLATVVSP